MGRRIYIHSHSLECLAEGSESNAREVFAAIASARAVKVINHHVADLGSSLGLIDVDNARKVVDAVGASTTVGFSSLLRRIGHRPRRPSEWSDFNPVLHPNEHVAASCQEGGYLTFATDEESGRIMYEDHARLSELWVAQMEGRGSKTLTMIKGRCLAFIEGHLPTGRGAASFYAPSIAAQALTPADVAGIRVDATNAVVARVLAAFDSALDQEQAIIDPQLRADVRRALRGLEPPTDSRFGQQAECACA